MESKKVNTIGDLDRLRDSIGMLIGSDESLNADWVVYQLVSGFAHTVALWKCDEDDGCEDYFSTTNDVIEEGFKRMPDELISANQNYDRQLWTGFVLGYRYGCGSSIIEGAYNFLQHFVVDTTD